MRILMSPWQLRLRDKPEGSAVKGVQTQRQKLRETQRQRYVVSGEREMYKVDVRVDAREAMAVARRRELEKQRQARVFNARERLIGVRQP